MTDLDDRLRAGVTALAERAEPTTGANDVITALGRGSTRSPNVGLRVAVAAAAFVVLAAVAVALTAGSDDATVVDSGPDTSVSTSVTTTSTTTRVVPTGAWDAATLGSGWHVLDRGPLPVGSPYVMTTSPNQLFVYGFSTPEDTVANLAYVYTPATGVWSEIPASPLSSTQALGGAWTGEEFAVWSTSGVAFWDPENELWRTGAAPPRALDRYPYWGGDGGWTGSQVVFWANALEYDITRDTWEEIPPPPAYPSRASSAFDGYELVVVGLASEQIPRTTAEIAFDPAANTWRTLPTSGLDGQALDLVTLYGFLGPQHPNAILGVDYQNHATIYDAERNSWTALEPLPLETGEDSRTVVALDGGRAFVTSTWTGQALLEADGRWTVVAGGPGGFRAAATTGGVFMIGEEFAVYVP